MNDEANETENPPFSSPEFPVARLEDRKARAWRVVGSSRMWWATVVAVIVAAVLVWRSVEESGPEIVIHFPQGHGLKAGDSIRHRGIEVGHVDEIRLNETLSGVTVTATLLRGAEGLARDGTQFWIVRPQLSLTEVRGLETAVGAKYIAVNLGNPNGEQRLEFDGLASAPPNELDEQGIEIVLRGDDSYRLHAGTPVSWRGVDVGEVLSVDLASDTRYVDVRVRVDSAYRTLVRTNSRFWVARGVGIDAGLTGLKIQAESLTTIARGGVSFITPTGGKEARHVREGHVFELHPAEDPEWTESSATVSLIDFPLPPTVRIRARWQEKQFGFTRNREQSASAILSKDDESGSLVLIGPLDTLVEPSGTIDGSWMLEVLTVAREEPLFSVPNKFKISRTGNGLGRCRLKAPQASEFVIEAGKLRQPTEPEDCCLVRSVEGATGPSSVIHSLSRTELMAADSQWSVDTNDELDRWHGAAVVATADGAVIGMFVAPPAGPAIALF